MNSSPLPRPPCKDPSLAASALRTSTCIPLLETNPVAQIIEQLAIIPLRISLLDELSLALQDEDIDPGILNRIAGLVRPNMKSQSPSNLNPTRGIFPRGGGLEAATHEWGSVPLEMAWNRQRKVIDSQLCRIWKMVKPCGMTVVPGAWAASCWLIRSCLPLMDGVCGFEAEPYCWWVR